MKAWKALKSLGSAVSKVILAVILLMILFEATELVAEIKIQSNLLLIVANLLKDSSQNGFRYPQLEDKLRDVSAKPGECGT